MTTKQMTEEVKKFGELANSTMTDIEYKAYKNSMVGKAEELKIALKEFRKVIFETKLWKRFYKIALKIFDKIEKLLYKI